MKSFIIFALIAGVLAGDRFVVDELIDMVPSWEDKSQLRVLMRNRDTPRSEIQQQIQDIVARQSQDIQNAYRILYEDRQNQMEQIYQRKLEYMQSRGSDETRITAMRQAHEVMNDLSLSESQARDRIREIYSAARRTTSAAP